MKPPCIDLNADLGEGAGNDAAIMPLISSVNIACGFHAGNAGTMLELVQLAKLNGVAIGAHPGYCDRENFGRKEMQLPERELYALVLYQLGALHAICKAQNTILHHVKPHGALYNQAANDPIISGAIVAAIRDFNPGLILYGLSGSVLITTAKNNGLTTVSEVFADRNYAPDGSLVPRSELNAVIRDNAAITRQIVSLVMEQTVRTSSGEMISLEADSVCLHGDGPDALAFAHTIHHLLTRENILIRAPDPIALKLPLN